MEATLLTHHAMCDQAPRLAGSSLPRSRVQVRHRPTTPFRSGRISMGSRSRTIDRRTFTIAAGGAAIAAVPTARALAQSATPVAGPAGTVVAEGLWNPRFLAFADDGSL